MMAHPLDGASAHVAHAEKLLRDLVPLVKAVEREYKESLFAKYDKQTDNITLGIKRPRPLPFDIALIVSHVIHDLRCALDYIVYELARHDSGQIQEDTQFVIQDKACVFAKQVKRRLKGLSPGHVAAIEQLQPYNGVEWTKTIREISNPDKHRQLWALDRDFFADIVAIRDDHGTLMPECDLILSAVGDAGFDVKVKFGHTITVKFEDGLPVVETLQALQAQVASAVESFKPEFE
jgi:hypothetical protein